MSQTNKQKPTATTPIILDFELFYFALKTSLYLLLRNLLLVHCHSFWFFSFINSSSHLSLVMYNFTKIWLYMDLYLFILLDIQCIHHVFFFYYLNIEHYFLSSARIKVSILLFNNYILSYTIFLCLSVIVVIILYNTLRHI